MVEAQRGYYVPVSETTRQFHLSMALIRLLFGPFGSAKSVTCAMEIVRASQAQKPWNGKRRTRWAVIRDTYRNLENTTIKTWREQLDTPKERLGRFVKSPIPTHRMYYRMPDQTIVDCEVLFMAIENQDDIEKLKSLEVSGFYLNEMSGLPEGLFGVMTGRFRFPAEAQGGITRPMIIGDTNGVAEDHWFADLVRNTPQDIEIFTQPPAAVEVGKNKWQINQNCDNYENLPENYYERQLGLYSRNERICYLGCGFASINQGLAVHEDYAEDIHYVDFDPDPALPIDIGMDWGLTPAAVLTQRRPDGGVDFIDEVVTDRADAKMLAVAIAKKLREEYPEFSVDLAHGDPAGNHAAQGDINLSCFGVFRANGFPQAQPTETNEPEVRRFALADPLRQVVRGVPMVRVRKGSCIVLNRGLAGKFQYKKIRGLENVYSEDVEKNKESHVCEAAEYRMLGYGFGRDIKHRRQQAKIVKTNMGRSNPNARR